MPKKTILSFDLASKTGFALGRTSVRRDTSSRSHVLLVSGAIDLHLLAEETHGSQLRRFREWLDSAFGIDGDHDCVSGSRHNLAGIYVEQAHLRGWSASIRAVGMYSILCYWADALPCVVPVTTVHTGTLKKFSTGHGKATKPQMIEAAANYWNVPIISDDHADALNLLRYGLSN